MHITDIVAIGLASLALGVFCGATAVIWAVNKALKERL